MNTNPILSQSAEALSTCTEAICDGYGNQWRTGWHIHARTVGRIESGGAIAQSVEVIAQLDEETRRWEIDMNGFREAFTRADALALADLLRRAAVLVWALDKTSHSETPSPVDYCAEPHRDTVGGTR